MILFRKSIRTILAIIIPVFIISCNKQNKIPLKESFHFISDTRPNGNIFDAINLQLEEYALEENMDSVLQFNTRNKAYKSNYLDIEFFPVLSVHDLQELAMPHFSKRKKALIDLDISQINFDTHFAFLVAHSSTEDSHSINWTNSSQTHYMDKLFIKEENNNVLHLNYQTSVLGNVDSTFNFFLLKWKVKVFVLERKHYEKLIVTLYDENYYFNLIDGNNQNS